MLVVVTTSEIVYSSFGTGLRNENKEIKLCKTIRLTKLGSSCLAKISGGQLGNNVSDR